MKKAPLLPEEVIKLENIYPVKKAKIPLIEGFKDGKPIFSEKPFYTYILVEKENK